ncbi:MAG TPA: RHS repeat-associated core domain-containing protein [Terriglobia bacterium]|nr:RHS repeat-associated core domain-containing protein [Terriglobia bacterium]
MLAEKLSNKIDGRWFTPDPLGGDITNPQSLNRYAYVLNNPATLTDPSGLGPCDAFEPWNCPPSCNPFDSGDCQCNANDGGICVQYCYELGTCNGRHGGGDGGSSGGGGAPAPPGPPGAGQPPLRGGGLGYWSLGCPFPSNSMGLCGLSPDYWTAQGGVAANLNFPLGISVSFFAGFAIDQHGHVAFYYGKGIGAGQGASGSAGLQFGTSNAYTNCGLAGPFQNASGTFGGEGVGATADVFQGKGNGPNGTVSGGGATIGLAGGGGASATVTQTTVVPIHGPSCP